MSDKMENTHDHDLYNNFTLYFFTLPLRNELDVILEHRISSCGNFSDPQCLTQDSTSVVKLKASCDLTVHLRDSGQIPRSCLSRVLVLSVLLLVNELRSRSPTHRLI